ncbi:unnamed protein product [Clonostachys rosea f. rosea IK726]|uniref:NAD(P)-binding domain-containing protein n=2 Tax=Bionectria ochroleuca TaxID=29856 RepID=A0A0B7JZ62_BIOOC|nr:unnamed protein product [Clonostachys rosea f. rosea IK726]
MAGASPIALILGSGPRVGSSIAKSLAAKGYQIVVTSRHGTGAKTPEGYLSLKADFSKPDSIPSVFDAIKSQLNTSPSVVVYNAAAATTPPKQDSVLSLPLDNFNADLNVNTVSAYVAAQQAVLGWETLPADTKKSFIYTGNILNVSILPVPFVLTLGTGKAASAFWLGLSDATYAPKSFRFFYADERNEDGTPVGNNIDGPAHGEFYAQLASQEQNIPWHATFVKGKGYVEFK